MKNNSLLLILIPSHKKKDDTIDHFSDWVPKEDQKNQNYSKNNILIINPSSFYNAVETKGLNTNYDKAIKIIVDAIESNEKFNEIFLVYHSAKNIDMETSFETKFPNSIKKYYSSEDNFYKEKLNPLKIKISKNLDFNDTLNEVFIKLRDEIEDVQKSKLLIYSMSAEILKAHMDNVIKNKYYKDIEKEIKKLIKIRNFKSEEYQNIFNEIKKKLNSN